MMTRVPGSRLMGGLAVVGTLWLSACGGQENVPVTRVGSPPAHVQPLYVPSAGPSGLAPVASWPKACQLVTVGDVRAILPQAAKIEHVSGDTPVEIVRGLATNKETVPGGACTYSFDLPHHSVNKLQPYGRIGVSVDVVGSPEVVRMNFDPHHTSTDKAAQDLGAQLGADFCVTRFNNVNGTYGCWKGNVAFSVSGSTDGTRWRQQDTFDEDGINDNAQPFYNRHVLPQFVKAATVRIP
jgi:hypothetical protein